MPFVPAARVSCVVCQKTVYANEELRIGEGISYHKTCFRCHHCNKVLQNTNYSQYNGIVYCKPHFMSLFKARGKYDDLATGDATARISNVVRENLSRTTALSLSEMKQDHSASRPAPHGKKDMGAALRSRNPQAVQALIEKKGLGVCFKAGSDGVTPIELAFANGNVECGRVMLKAVQDALNSKDYEMEKPDTEEDKNDVPVTRAYSQSVAAVSAPAPIVAQEPAAVSAAPRRSSIEDRIRKFSDPKPVAEAPAAQAVEEPERHLITVKPNVAMELKTESSHEHSNDEHAYYASEETKNWLSSPMSSPEGAKQWEKHTSPRADNVPQGSFNNSAINA